MGTTVIGIDLTVLLLIRGIYIHIACKSEVRFGALSAV
jgi:hypothetical protein